MEEKRRFFNRIAGKKADTKLSTMSVGTQPTMPVEAKKRDLHVKRMRNTQEMKKRQKERERKKVSCFLVFPLASSLRDVRKKDSV